MSDDTRSAKWLTPDEGVGAEFSAALVQAVQFVETRFGDMFFQGKAAPLSSIGASMMGRGAFVAGVNGSTLENEIAIIRAAADKLIEELTNSWGSVGARRVAEKAAEQMFDQLMESSRKALDGGRTIDSFVSRVEMVHLKAAHRGRIVLPDGHVPILAYRTFSDGDSGAVPMPAGMNALEMLTTEDRDESHAVLILIAKAEHVPYLLSVVMNDTDERRSFIERCFARAQRSAEAAEGRAVH